MKHFSHDGMRDLQAIIEELAVLKKRLDSLKLKMDLALGLNRGPYRAWVDELREIKI
ncbi:hypothetical protein [Campylobacter concisus]|uniref:hypothetical protein n=1 Tax=Campylobacter concisus TaxID=199 RepID=UPI0015E1A479|nr:hypothetical protein [Campylobacter concisus]DAR76791.1 MAG TPA: hypothetical protein [Caudoviricetes sp.]